MDGFLSLARKWRPRRLADLSGHEYATGALRNAVVNNRIHHAFLFTGTRGVGKTTLARILAMLFNCEKPANGEPCLECANCKAIADGACTDVVEIDAASHTGVENMREVLEGANYAPAQGKFKVFIIDEVHMLSRNTFNAMLKTLEEPPSHVKFVLATTEAQKIPPTVISRCLCFSLTPLSRDVIAARLAHILKSEKCECEQAALAEIARLARGSMRDALSILDQAIAHGNGAVTARDVRQLAGDTDIGTLVEMLRAISAADGKKITELCAALAANNASPDAVLARLASLIHKAAFLAVLSDEAREDEDKEETEAASGLAGVFSPERLQVLYEIFLRGRRQMPFAPDEQTGLEMTLLRAALFAPSSSGNIESGGQQQSGGKKPSAPSSSSPKAQSAAAQEVSSSSSQHPPPPMPKAKSQSKQTAQQSKPSGRMTKWSDVMERLNPAARQLADKCIVEHFDAKGVILWLDESCAKALDNLRDHLEGQLRDFFGGGFNVKIAVAKGNAAGDADREERERRARAHSFAGAILSQPGARLLDKTE